MTESQAQQMKELAITIASYHPDSLCRGEEKFNFGEYRPLFMNVQRFFQLLSGLRLDLLPESPLHNQLERVKNLKEALDRIIAFNPLSGGDPNQRRQETASVVSLN